METKLGGKSNTFCFETTFNRSGGKKLLRFQTLDGIFWRLIEEWKPRPLVSDLIEEWNPPLVSSRITENSVEYFFFSEHKAYYAELTIFEKWNPKMNPSLKRIQNLSALNGIKIKFEDFCKELNLGNQSETPLICRIDLIPVLSLFNVNALPPPPPLNTKAVSSTENRLENLSSDMHSLFDNVFLSDVVLVSNTTEINAHKVILAARSPVFARMFDLPMKENLENRVTIADVDSTVLKELVSFMYTGKITLREAVVGGLYTAADKYGIDDLKAICSSRLRNLTLDTVMEAFILAENHNDRNLKEAAMNFIAAHYDQLKTKESWDIFLKKYPVYSVEIFKYVMDRRL